MKDPCSAAAGRGSGHASLAATAVINVVGDANASYRQNMMLHRNAFALVMVPMIKPPGAAEVARKSYKGTSVRVIPFYDGINDIANYRLDMLFGVRLLDGRLATRLSGSP